MAGAVLDHDERNQASDADDAERPRAIDETPGRAGEADNAEHGTLPVEPARGVRRPRLGYVANRDPDDQCRQRQVEQEDPAPRGGVDEPTPGKRSDRRGDATEPGPCADRPCPVVRVERGLDDRQASRREQCATDALQHAGGDEDADAGCGAAQQRREGEPDHTDDEDPTTAEPVTERSADEDQGCERERVARHHPLETGEAGIEIVAETGQGDVDDGRVERDHPGAEHRPEQHPARRGGPESDRPVVRLLPRRASSPQHVRRRGARSLAAPSWRCRRPVPRATGFARAHRSAGRRLLRPLSPMPPRRRPARRTRRR